MTMSKFFCFGHRGAAGHEPENTLRSFKKALSLGVEMVEMDIWTCKTGELVVMHDNTVNRTTNGKGYVWDLSFEDLRALNAGKGEKIPLLYEVLDLLGKEGKVNLELKGEGTARPMAKLLERYAAEKQYNYHNFYISSFNHYLLKEARTLFPKDCGIRICPLICGIPIKYAEFAECLGAYSVNIAAEFANEDFVKDAHGRGMKVFAYVVNDIAELARMRSMGVDGIFTDYPDIEVKNK